jgi:acylglycerol lipase
VFIVISMHKSPLRIICLGALLLMSVSSFGQDATLTAKWKSFDGAHFPYSKWIAKNGNAPRAVIIGVHGISGAASDFSNLGSDLSQKGISVYAYELRGQGNDPDPERVGDLKDAQLWFSDLNSFISSVRKEIGTVPIFLYGESIGSLILMHGFSTISKENKEQIEGIIYSSPLIALPGKLPPIKNLLVRTAMFLWPSYRVSLRSLSGGGEAKVSEGEDHWEQMAKTKHYVPKFTLRALGIIERMVLSSSKAASKIKKPVLVLHPGKDIFTKPHEVDQFFNSLEAKDKSKKLFKESHHLLAFDKERDELFKIVLEWIKNRS